MPFQVMEMVLVLEVKRPGSWPASERIRRLHNERAQLYGQEARVVNVCAKSGLLLCQQPPDYTCARSSFSVVVDC